MSHYNNVPTNLHARADQDGNPWLSKSKLFTGGMTPEQLAEVVQSTNYAVISSVRTPRTNFEAIN